MIRSAFRSARKAMFMLIPYNRTGDKIISYYNFYRVHNRLPRRRMVFNDVLFYIKTSAEILDPARVFTTDKEFVKIFIKSVLGDEYNVPTIEVLHSMKEVYNYTFPARCAIKPTHSSGPIILRLDGEDIDFDKISRWFGVNYYKARREANYRYLKPKLIVEPLLFNTESVEDIKFFCFRGKVKLVFWDFDRRTNHTRKLYTRDWKELEYSLGFPMSTKTKPRPGNLREMIVAAERLAEMFEFVRIDMYTNDREFRVGEITHVHGSAGSRFFPTDAEERASEVIFKE